MSSRNPRAAPPSHTLSPLQKKAVLVNGLWLTTWSLANVNFKSKGWNEVLLMQWLCRRKISLLPSLSPLMALWHILPDSSLMSSNLLHIPSSLVNHGARSPSRSNPVYGPSQPIIPCSYKDLLRSHWLTQWTVLLWSSIITPEIASVTWSARNHWLLMTWLISHWILLCGIIETQAFTRKVLHNG